MKKQAAIERFVQRIGLVTVLLLSFHTGAVLVQASIKQPQSEVKKIEPGQPIDSEIAGGESHTYLIARARAAGDSV